MELLTPTELANKYSLLNSKQLIDFIGTDFNTIAFLFVELTTIEQLCIDIKKAQLQLFGRLNKQLKYEIECCKNNIHISLLFDDKECDIFNNPETEYFISIKNINQSVLETNNNERLFRFYLQ